jgi:hypothetical protein
MRLSQYPGRSSKHSPQWLSCLSNQCCDAFGGPAERVSCGQAKAAMGMRLIAGRDFSWQGTDKSEHVIIINEAAARPEWPNEIRWDVWPRASAMEIRK